MVGCVDVTSFSVQLADIGMVVGFVCYVMGMCFCVCMYASYVSYILYVLCVGTLCVCVCVCVCVMFVCIPSFSSMPSIGCP